MIKHFSPLDTTDVQGVEVDRENRLYIRCYFAQGSEALGCSVELVSPEDSVLWNITRENGSPVAERNITTPLAAHCYNISVSDLKRDGTVGEVAVLVVEAEWDEACNPDSNPGSGAPPTSRKGTIICGYQYKALDFLHSRPAETSRSVGAIVGGSVGGVVIISIMLVLLLTAVIYKKHLYRSIKD